MYSRAARFPMIDAVRAVACLWVMAFHAAFLTGFIHDGNVLRPWLAQAGTAAMIFFLISGFLLYRPFVAAHVSGGRAPSGVTFWWRRLLRVVPGYWVALTLITVALGTTVAAATDVFSARGWLAYYGFAQIYNSDTAIGGIPQAWTLCVEMTFYALLPVWALCVRLVPWRRERSRAHVELAAAGALIVAGVAYKVWLLTQVDPTSFEGSVRFFPLPNYLDAFGLGMLIAVLSVWDGRPEFEERGIALIRRRPGLVWLAAALLLFTAGIPIGWSGDPADPVGKGAFVARWELQIAAGTLLLLPAIFGEPSRGLVGRLLSTRALLWLGLVSYGFYLYHYALIDLFERHLGDAMPSSPTARFAIYVVLAAALGAALAGISYYALERPFLRLKNLIGRTPQAAGGEAIAESAPAEAPRPS